MYPNHRRASSGFTFLELMVVVALISILLFFSVPRFQNAMGASDQDKTARWIITKVRLLKDRAVTEQRPYFLHAELETNRLWISHAGMSEEQITEAQEKALSISSELKLVDVEFTEQETITSGMATIRFFPSGYSDMAAIHFELESGDYQSIIIEPFMSRVEIIDALIRFEG